MDLPFDVVELPDADHVAEGDLAPDFERPLVGTEYWEDAALSDLLADGPVVLVFYTMDGAFPATYIWNEIRDRAWSETDAEVVGLSISTPYEHATLIEERRMDHRLFSDPANEVAEAFGVEHDLDGMAGVAEPRPAVFVIDDERRIEYAWAASEWPEFPDYDAVESALARVT